MKQKLSDKLAKAWGASGKPDWDVLRDFCDIRTGGELPGMILDRVTDAVMRRLNKTEADANG